MKPEISLSCWDYDRARPILEGLVEVEGFTLKPEVGSPGKLFPLAVGDAPYDVTEMSFASYLIQTARGENKYIGVPVPLSRAFRHGAIYVRTDSDIKTPSDLEGRTVGVAEYAMTMALWVRGLLSDEYGVDVTAMRYRTAGINEPGRVERLTMKLPDAIDLAPLGEGRWLDEALLAGDIDAIFSAATPTAFAEGNPAVRRLIDPPAEAERDYYARTGIFPIMHVLGIKHEVAERHPDLAGALYDAFLEGRRIAMKRAKAVAEASANRDMSPWYADAYEHAVRVMGPDFWPYGIDANRASFEAISRYAHEQFLTPTQLDIDNLFHPGVYGKPSV